MFFFIFLFWYILSSPYTVLLYFAGQDCFSCWWLFLLSCLCLVDSFYCLCVIHVFLPFCFHVFNYEAKFLLTCYFVFLVFWFFFGYVFWSFFDFLVLRFLSLGEVFFDVVFHYIIIFHEIWTYTFFRFNVF